MNRSYEPEVLDSSTIPEQLADRAYRDLTRIHRLMGDTRAVLRAIRRDPLPVRRVLDIGCARAGVSRDMKRALGVEVIGIDIAPAENGSSPIPVIRADATRDALPTADLAYCMHVAHHLRDLELIAMIRNVSRSCRRLILLDLVRHRLPLFLFRMSLARLVCPITARDGDLSIRRAYTPRELRGVVEEAVAGTGASFRHSVAPFWIRQIVEVSWPR